MTKLINAPFPEVFTLNAVQAHVQTVCEIFDWNKINNEKTFLLFIEEVGELAKAFRRLEALAIEKNKALASDEALQRNVSEEFADVLSYLCDLANRYGVDLEESYRLKMTDTLQRDW